VDGAIGPMDWGKGEIRDKNKSAAGEKDVNWGQNVKKGGRGGSLGLIGG